jgi:hypothetical protein
VDKDPLVTEGATNRLVHRLRTPRKAGG